MKSTIKRSAPFLIGILAGVVSSLQTSTASPNISYFWGFSSSNNPAAPESAVGGTGVSQAAIAPGEFSTGWIASNPILGSAQGIWDLGRSGTITLSNPAGLAGGSGQERLITASVTQYQDGGIYAQLAVVSVPGAVLVSSNASVTAPAYIGEWVQEQTQWRAPAGPLVNSISVAGVSSGSLVDSVTVESSFSAVQRPQLAIRKAGLNNSKVEVSWPASYTSFGLESTGNINDPLSWTPVSAQSQVNGSVRSVTLDISGSASFYRLKQP